MSKFGLLLEKKDEVVFKMWRVLNNVVEEGCFLVFVYWNRYDKKD